MTETEFKETLSGLVKSEVAAATKGIGDKLDLLLAKKEAPPVADAAQAKADAKPTSAAAVVDPLDAHIAKTEGELIDLRTVAPKDDETEEIAAERSAKIETLKQKRETLRLIKSESADNAAAGAGKGVDVKKIEAAMKEIETLKKQIGVATKSASNDAAFGKIADKNTERLPRHPNRSRI